MEFAQKLAKGIIEKRYKRFFADIQTPQGPITAHVPNTGSLKGALELGSDCLYSTVDDPKRKLPHTLQMVRQGSNWVGVNTALANQIVWEAFTSRSLDHWSDYDQGQREYRISSETRLDMALWNSKFPEKKHYVEVKNVTMAKNGLALFPDAVTERGQKHLRELAKLVQQGASAEIFFLIQREDCTEFSPAAEIDSVYAQELLKAKTAGVRISAYACRLNEFRIELVNRPLRCRLQGDDQ